MYIAELVYKIDHDDTATVPRSCLICNEVVVLEISSVRFQYVLVVRRYEKVERRWEHLVRRTPTDAISRPLSWISLP